MVTPLSRSHVQTRNAWIFFAITVIEAIANCAFEAVLFYFVASSVDLRNDQQSRIVPTYLSIYILALIFQVVFTFLAIKQRNTIQIMGLVIFNASFVAYSAVQVSEIPQSVSQMDYIDTSVTPDQLDQKMRPFLIIIPVITGIAQMAYMYLAYRIYQDFGWLVFKRLGADRKIHRYYFYYEIFVCLLKFDFFFFVGFSIQLLILNLSIHDVETWLTVAAIPVAIVFIVIGVWSTRHEIHWLQALFDVGIVAGAAYFGFKLWRIWDTSDPERALSFENDRKSLTIFASIALALMVTTFCISVVCQINFGRGLKKYLVTNKSKESYVSYDYNNDDVDYRLAPIPGKRVVLD